MKVNVGNNHMVRSGTARRAFSIALSRSIKQRSRRGKVSIGFDFPQVVHSSEAQEQNL